MLQVKGKYNTATVWSSRKDVDTIKKIQTICDDYRFEDTNIVIMPDYHGGQDDIVGLTISNSPVIPDFIGADIGCTVSAVKLRHKLNPKELDDFLKETRLLPEADFEFATNLINSLNCCKSINKELAIKTLGTLGHGNHFLELDEDEEGNQWLVIHTGSRSLGGQVYKHYKSIAENHLNDTIRDLLPSIKPRYRQLFFKLYKRVVERPKFPHLTGKRAKEYIHDCQTCIEFAKLNHEVIIQSILRHFKTSVVDSYLHPHNFIDNAGTLRKGATRCVGREKIIVPLNMRDGTVICQANSYRGHFPWVNFSAPHGAGRAMSRRKAKETITVNKFKEEVDGIYSSRVDSYHVDEAPSAYHDTKEFLKDLKLHFNIVHRLKPIYNYKD